MPNTEALCEAATNSSNPAGIIAGGTWNGCNPNTVMSTNWRASLVPAAAVIPAPAAYTNIAAVETFVVGLWATGLPGGRWDPPPPAGTQGVSTPSLPAHAGSRRNTTPGSMVQCPHSDGLISSCAKSPSVGIGNGRRTPHMLGRRRGCWPSRCHTNLPVSITGVYHRSHRGKPSVPKATRTG